MYHQAAAFIALILIFSLVSFSRGYEDVNTEKDTIDCASQDFMLLNSCCAVKLHLEDFLVSPVGVKCPLKGEGAKLSSSINYVLNTVQRQDNTFDFNDSRNVDMLGPYARQTECLFLAMGMINEEDELNYLMMQNSLFLIGEPVRSILDAAIKYCRPHVENYSVSTIMVGGKGCLVKPYIFQQCIFDFFIHTCPKSHWKNSDKCNSKRDAFNRCRLFPSK